MVEAQQSTAPAPHAAQGSSETTLPPTEARGETIPGAETEDEEERLLAQALAMSTQDGDVEMGDAEGIFTLYLSI